jgi:PAS domain S-box-containing protein
MRRWTRSGLVWATILLYAAALAPLFHVAGDAAMALAALPLAMVGWSYGWRFGLLAGLLSVPLHLLGLTLLGRPGWWTILSSWPIWLLSLAVGPAGGWTRERIPTLSDEAEGGRDQFFDLSLDMLCIAGTDGYFKQLNHAWERTLGFSRAELCAHPFMDFIHPDDRQPTHAAVARLTSGQPVINFENRYRHRDGDYRWLVWTCSAFGKDHSLICGVARDITEQKQAELALRTSEKRFRAMVENAGAGITVCDRHGQLTDCNGVWIEMMGYTRDELFRLSAADYLHPDDLASEQTFCHELLEGRRDSYQLTLRYIHKSGRVWWGHLSRALIRDETGAPQSSVAVVKDMTDQQKAEAASRRLGEELEQRVGERTEELLIANRTLRTLESWQRTLIGAIPGIVWECSAKSWLFTFVSPQAEALLGYPISRWLDQPDFWQAHIHPDDRAWVLEYCANAANTEARYAFEYRMIAADGRTVWLQDIVTVEREEEPVILRGIMVDITDSKQTVAALVASEQQFRLLAEHAMDVIFRLDQTGRILYVSPASLSMLGYTLGDMSGSPFTGYLPAAERPKAVEAFDQAVTGLSISSLELAIVAKDGALVPVEVNMGPIREDGAITGVHGILRDLRDRRRAEDELRRSWAFIDSIVDNLPHMVFVKDAKELRFVRFNKAGEELLGYDRHTLLGETDYAFFPKEEADFFTNMDRAVLNSGRLLDIPAEPIQTKAHGLRILHTKKIPLYDDKGIPQYLLGISEDITEHKQAEQALRDSEERLQQAVRVGHIGIFDHDHVTNRVYWSQEQREIFGWAPHEPLTLEQGFAQICEEDRTRILEAVQRAHEPGGDGGIEVEFRIIDRQGASRWLSARSRTWFEGEGSARRQVRTIGAVADITARKQTEQALRRSEEQLRAAMEEREELAQNLHDNIIQTIYAIGLILEECRHLLGKNHGKVDKRLGQTITYLNKVIVDIRHYIAWATQEDMTGDQLCTKVADLAKRMEGVRDMRMALELDSSAATRLTPAQALHVLSIVQEAISNCLRHAQSQSGRISLQVFGQRIRLEISDDGIGFTRADAGRRGHGLQNMAMRAEKLGGRCEVVSTPGRGTQILVEFPWEGTE